MGFRFVHAADLHLDSPFKGSDVDRRATFRAFSRIVDLAIREQAAFVLVAGDLFDARDRSVRARLHLAAEVSRLSAAGVQTFIVHGNHDPLGTLEPGAGLPEGAKVFGPQWEEVPVERDGQVLCRIQGISYAQEKVTENLALRFRRTGPEFSIALLHANVGGDATHANYAPCTLGELGSRGLDYWALGHVHTRAQYPLEGGGVAVYPGNPQGRHIHEDGARGCALVEVSEGRASVRFVSVEPVRWHKVSVDIAEVSTLEALSDLLHERLSVLANVEGPQAHVARVTLAGRGVLHRELTCPGVVDQLEESWREALGQRTPPWSLERLKDETRAELDFEALRAGGGLLGAVLELSSEGDGLWEDEELRKLEARLRAANLPSPRSEGVTLVREATEAVAELLVEETQ